ncbi:uncharacterized protein [Cardiocondyla obscurior]|uniref:uncharacterized protein n=1 Tax=Cardiocondyla obscurior TaxID=286306 RepID=UPI003965691C
MYDEKTFEFNPGNNIWNRINHNLTKVQEFVLTDESHLLRQVYYKQRNSFLIIKLKALKKQHLMVSDTVQILNMTFILSMAKEEEEFWYWFFLISVIYYTIKILLIVWVCDSGTNQATKIGITVHNLLNNTSNKQIKNELQLFSMQILHRDNVFSAKGLTVDATLLTGRSYGSYNLNGLGSAPKAAQGGDLSPGITEDCSRPLEAT